MKLFLSIFLLAASLQAREYSATVLTVTDADTIIVIIDLGLDVSKREKIRLANIDAFEKGTPKGIEARAYLSRLLSGKEILLVTSDDTREKYGRLLAIVYLKGEDINQLLIEKGFAKEYHGGKRG